MKQSRSFGTAGQVQGCWFAAINLKDKRIDASSVGMTKQSELLRSLCPLPQGGTSYAKLPGALLYQKAQRPLRLSVKLPSCLRGSSIPTQQAIKTLEAYSSFRTFGVRPNACWARPGVEEPFCRPKQKTNE